jgi:prepilin-type N-terminal cleavage/methylation domain-containing protein
MKKACAKERNAEGPPRWVNFRRKLAAWPIPDSRLPTLGFTLVELLIVIAIISTVTLASVPMILPALDSRRIRESARIVSTQFASAQSEAIAKGRPVGVWIERLSSTATGGTTASMDLFLCEVPQPYAGDSVDSRVAIRVDTSKPPAPRYYLEFTASDSSWTGLPLRPGDLIRFNYRGPLYEVTGDAQYYKDQLIQTDSLLNNVVQSDNQGKYISSSPTMKVAFDRIRRSSAPAAPSQPWNMVAQNYIDCAMPPANAVLPYQIFRQPVKSSAGSVQLPAGAILDLYWSGMGSTGSFSTPSTTEAKSPIIVTFDRTGSLDSYYIGGIKQSITGPLYFLVGKREKAVGIETDTTKQNWTDLENIWVAINPTGTITTAELAAATPPSVAGSRVYAQAAQTMGGR